MDKVRGEESLHDLSAIKSSAIKSLSHLRLKTYERFAYCKG